ncbi:TrkH family potassium uptake protein [Spirochaeta isovalerica]|uniref:Trk system potassium uptake protein TrkH n=1 Tax=Spirochaeta isovalerica TaxID=150 RepID=A0A841RBI7_9SPIO|nr:TrkH family potassium uptake protein [Spirochaeta isovalerica]MBB6481335.1 trk system potassium uptake protein TrkH [Spirochaeta isovalerica]
MKKFLLFVLLILGVTGLFFENRAELLGNYRWIITVIDYILVLTLLAESIQSFVRAGNKLYYLRKNIPSLIFLVVYLGLFLSNKVLSQRFADAEIKGYFAFIIIRNILLILKVYGRMRKFSGFLHSIFSKPAQTVVLSFILVILAGTFALMMPMMTTGGRIDFINSLFTVTSAVCVTGLAVVDTAGFYTFWGHLTIMVLIQIGGLGIMLLSFFLVFSFRKKVSIKDRSLLTYMLNESDMASIIKSVKRIIILTFSIEGGGALLLYPQFINLGKKPGEAMFYSLFHAVSAFCNAGFALFSDSLESFSSSPAMNFTIAGLIIAGGISFTVLTDLFSGLKALIRRKQYKLSINTKVVVQFSFFLTLAGMFIIYKLEHVPLLLERNLGEQYLSAFFQSVTLRTAGFNTLPMGSLQTGTLIVMIGIMFIGGASGSTAGGIKVNTLGVVQAYIHSFRKGHDETLIYRHQVSKDQILQAFTVIAFGVLSIFIVLFLLLLTEDAPLSDLMFESVSAFATVGLSTGITGSLSPFGKVFIIILMFIGRIGPLTLLSATSGRSKASPISYPEATLLIG